MSKDYLKRKRDCIVDNLEQLIPYHLSGRFVIETGFSRYGERTTIDIKFSCIEKEFEMIKSFDSELLECIIIDLFMEDLKERHRDYLRGYDNV